MKKLIGYVNGRDLKGMREEDILLLDIINIAFAHVVDNHVVWEDGKECREGLRRVQDINKSLKLVLSVGGWGADGFSQAAMTAETRERFAQSAVRLLLEYHLDGIDIDWEYPCTSLSGISSDPRDKYNYTKLAEVVRRRMDETGEDLTLSIAAGGDTYFTKQTQMKELSEFLDYVQLMTYDLQGGFQTVTGHHSALYQGKENLFDCCVDKAVRVFLEAGVPREKLVVGIPFYSRLWKGVRGNGSGIGREAETAGGYGPDYGSLTRENLEENGYQRYWDPEARVPVLFDGNNFITYDDPESISEKVKYIIENELGGIMFWEYRCDSTHTLIPGIAEELRSAGR